MPDYAADLRVDILLPLTSNRRVNLQTQGDTPCLLTYISQRRTQPFSKFLKRRHLDIPFNHTYPTTTVHTSAPQSKGRNKNNTRKAIIDTRTSSGAV